MTVCQFGVYKFIDEEDDAEVGSGGCFGWEDEDADAVAIAAGIGDDDDDVGAGDGDGDNSACDEDVNDGVVVHADDVDGCTGKEKQYFSRSVSNYEKLETMDSQLHGMIAGVVRTVAPRSIHVCRCPV